MSSSQFDSEWLFLLLLLESCLLSSLPGRGVSVLGGVEVHWTQLPNF